MELPALQESLLVADSHDLSLAIWGFGPCGHLKVAVERIGLNHETVVAGCDEWIRQAFEQAKTVVMNLVRLAVHKVLGCNNSSARRLDNRLMT